LIRRVAKWSILPVAFGAVVLATIVLVFAIQARVRLPALHGWHRLELKEEFHAGAAGAPASFEEYRRLEDRLFSELRRRILDDPKVVDTYRLSRFRPESIPAHLALDTPYNRSFELMPAAPRGAVLLVHGLTDSPYAMRSIAQTFFDEGYYVLVLRLPGHGTIPAALRDVSWRDWYGAVVLAAKHAATAAGPGKPLLAGGFSTGAALVTLYSLRALDDTSLPQPEQLYLVSAAIGISKFAVLTNVLAGLGFVPYFEKSKWLDVMPEYDPYKYNSFPVNAANQIYGLTKELQSTLVAAEEAGRLSKMPHVLVFQSLVDATILAEDVVKGLLAHLPPNDNELVVFDINRRDRLEALLAPGPVEALNRLNAASWPFRITVVSNLDPSSKTVATFTREAGSREVTVGELPLAWPPGVLSLGHVALPFPIDDPVYGLTPPPGDESSYPLGTMAARGESGAMIVSFDSLARLRSNPFFDVIRSKIRETLAAEAR
jgi:alpha-beta hydrolase superfamily lysophospholipase